MKYIFAFFLPLYALAAEIPSPMASHMMIDLKERASDYKEAFEALKKEKPVAKIFFQLNDGNMISNIVEMSLMGNGHLILFKFNTQQGIKHQVVPVEQISQLSYQQ